MGRSTDADGERECAETSPPIPLHRPLDKHCFIDAHPSRGDGWGHDDRAAKSPPIKSASPFDRPPVVRWTWAGVLERLKGIRRQTVTMNGTVVTLTSRPDEEQQELLRLLKVPT
jgi:hypothetical protein